MAIAMIVVLAAFYVQSYAGRVRLVHAQRAGCERQKQRDYNAAIAWSVAAATRRLERDTGTAAAYDQAATTYWRYAVTSCASAYPSASPIGL
jgi:hypothetical protein